MKAKTTELSRRERQIMEAVYAAGEATAADVRGAIPDAPSDSAVRTFLRLLVDKGHLRHKRDGLRYVYSPVKQKHHAGKSMLRNVVRTFFGGSVEQAVVTLLSSDDITLSKEQSERLAGLIERATEEESK